MEKSRLYEIIVDVINKAKINLSINEKDILEFSEEYKQEQQNEKDNKLDKI